MRRNVCPHGLTCECLCVEHAGDGEHGKATVLQLTELCSRGIGRGREGGGKMRQT